MVSSYAEYEPAGVEAQGYRIDLSSLLPPPLQPAQGKRVERDQRRPYPLSRATRLRGDGPAGQAEPARNARLSVSEASRMGFVGQLWQSFAL